MTGITYLQAVQKIRGAFHEKAAGNSHYLQAIIFLNSYPFADISTIGQNKDAEALLKAAEALEANQPATLPPYFSKLLVTEPILEG